MDESWTKANITRARGECLVCGLRVSLPRSLGEALDGLEGQPGGARMVRRHVLRRLSALHAGRGADRGRDLPRYAEMY